MDSGGRVWYVHLQSGIGVAANEIQRVDPNRIFWQRNAALEQQNSNPTERPTTANRPPSYISEDGIDYVVEAQPRSIAPTTDVPLPVHPSERGRVWQRP